MMVWVAAIFASYVAWTLNGINSTVILLYPCLIVFSVLLCGWVSTVYIALYLIITLYCFVLADMFGLGSEYDASTESPWGKVNNILIILILSLLGMLMIARLFKQAITRLSDESLRSEQLEALAKEKFEYDSLTKLPNINRAEIEFSDFRKKVDSVHNLAIITVDINNFKLFNSTLGREVGDRVILSLAERLVTLIGDAKLYRSTGSEFLILKFAEEYSRIEELAEQISRTLESPILIEDYEVEPRSSLGIAVSPDDGLKFIDLRRKSQTALIEARQQKGGYCFFDTQIEKKINQKLNLIKDIKQGLRNDEFLLYYQPIIDLSTGKAIAAEALIRWIKKDGTQIFPDQFIPQAEASGLINELGEWIINQACTDAKHWTEQGFENICVAVNLSPVQFRKGNLQRVIAEALSYTGLPAKLLYLEITESLFVEDIEFAQAQINSLVGMGCEFAIDDFGAGYSNLNYLHLFNASKLKIDRSFVGPIVESVRNQHIVKAIVEMSHGLGLTNIAEGVEDEETAKFLNSTGCILGQGYYWSRPVPFNEFLNFLDKNINQNA
ncbi:MAG: bifunctional diguanylate cyclase/phosphodiesterase [Gammaproteobacteria bacterium]|nr:bifunctional diguanylate cyclase/phosphodiesterase [Gammaproteobacteria bacterium]